MKGEQTGKRPMGFAPGRRLQLMIDPRNDPYQAKARPRAARRCPSCGLVCLQGRWQVASAPAEAREQLCPACHRTHDGLPAGIVTVSGDFALAHREDVLRCARNFADRIQAEHPLQRIIAIDEYADHLVITTTDVHLAQGLGRALHHAFHGRLRYGFSQDEYLLRVDWQA